MELSPKINQIPEGLDEVLDISNIFRVDAGHMMYNKSIVETPTGNYFVKTSDDSLLTEPYHARKMWEYLVKEGFAYDLLSQNGFEHIPTAVFHNRSLILEAHGEENGWHWECPVDQQREYTASVLSALRTLEQVPIAETLNILDPEQSAIRLLKRGWATLRQDECAKIDQQIERFLPQLHPHVIGGVRPLRALLNSKSALEMTEKLQTYATRPCSTVAHFDARQTNIAWHPNHGVKIVDWSWVSAGPSGSDTTMFLIDLHKSDMEVMSHLDRHFDPKHALLLIGYWLARSIEPSPTPDSTVRFHQLASAITAAHLLDTI